MDTRVTPGWSFSCGAGGGGGSARGGRWTRMVTKNFQNGEVFFPRAKDEKAVTRSGSHDAEGGWERIMTNKK